MLRKIQTILFNKASMVFAITGFLTCHMNTLLAETQNNQHDAINPETNMAFHTNTALVESKNSLIYTLKPQAITDQVDVAGTVAALNTTRFTAQIPGRIEFIAGEEGDHFKKNQELLRIDDSALRAKWEAATAKHDEALASIRNASAQLRREVYSPQSRAGSSAPGGMGMPSMMDQMFTNPMQNMMGMRDRGSERQSDLINRETQLTQANSRYKQAQAQIKEIEASLRDARTLAPFNGVVEILDVEVGDTVQPGQSLLTFSGISGHRIEIDVPVRLVVNLHQGMPLATRLDGTGDTLTATISRIFPVADRNQHTVRVELELPLGSHATVGQYTEVAIPSNTTNKKTEAIDSTNRCDQKRRPATSLCY
ncbi:MAG: HlyD family efflux transporter periplasmic adaptor subunit [Candidatus Thiodiazotropha sp. (ex Lucinoma annulata)]|nr:HlyD family efflux transporter periplasmic adaptor subunit [Candidatus Thiodiazotropha sp. (ex Lucinoma annulata)]